MMAITIPRDADHFSAVPGMVIGIVGIIFLNRLNQSALG